MRRTAACLIYILIVLLMFIFLGCASGPRGKLKRVQDPTEEELRRNWKEYTVYYRRDLALIFKLKNDSKILLDGSWIEVNSGNMMKNARILSSTWVKEIIGQNDRMFGYLVHRGADNVYCGIVDENTVKISYFYVRTSGGP